jgi:choline dehydrogenase-like flavoprotein
MHRFTLLVSVAGAIAACALVFGAGVAGADPGNGNGALVVNDTGCAVFDGNGVYGSFTTDTHSVVNKGMTLVICKADVANDTGKAVTYDDQNNPFGPGTLYNCWNGTFGGTWHETISASGKSTTVVTCPAP